MAYAHSITIQRGHCFRKSGSTGTVREQEFTNALGTSLTNKLQGLGWEVHLVNADPPGRQYPKTKYFLALHCDGSTNASAHGASYFYPPRDQNVTPAWGQAWQAAHQQIAGYRWGFRRPNYVSSVSTGFYAWRDSRVQSGQGTPAEVCMLCEHYFATNGDEAAWAWSPGTIDKMADAHVAALLAVAGTPQLSSGGDMIFECESNGKKHAWLSYSGLLRHISQGTAHGANGWSNMLPLVPCSIGQMRAIRATAYDIGVLQDNGVDTKDFPDDFWESVPYCERPKGQRSTFECNCDPVIQCEGSKDISNVTSAIKAVDVKVSALGSKLDGFKGGITNEELSTILRELSEEVANWE